MMMMMIVGENEMGLTWLDHFEVWSILSLCPVLPLTEHHAMKAWSGGTAPPIL